MNYDLHPDDSTKPNPKDVSLYFTKDGDEEHHVLESDIEQMSVQS